MKTYIYILTLFLLSISSKLTAQDLVMANSTSWPLNYTLTSSLTSLTMGNNTTLNVEYTLTINNNLTALNNAVINVSGDLNILGDIIIKNNGSVIINGIINATGNVEFENNSNLTVNGQMGVGGNLNIGSNSTLNGTGEIGVIGAITLGTNTTVDTNLNLHEGPLPVELLDFNLNNNDNNIVLNWATASEINNDYFTIEESLEMINWKIAAIIKGNGNTNEISNYSISLVKQNNSDVIYYRLKQTDYDGKYKYLSIIAFKNNSNNNNFELSAYPDERNLYINLDNNFQENQPAEMRIIDLNGRLIKLERINIEKGQNQYVITKPDIVGIHIVSIATSFKQRTVKVNF